MTKMEGTSETPQDTIESIEAAIEAEIQLGIGEGPSPKLADLLGRLSRLQAQTPEEFDIHQAFKDKQSGSGQHYLGAQGMEHPDVI